MNKYFATIIGIVILIALVAFTTSYSVPFHEVAIVSTLGETKGADSVVNEPGPKMKWPAPFQTVRTLDTRYQLVETRLDTVPTSDGLQVIVKAFLLWKVDETGEGPLAFAKAYPGIEAADRNLELWLRNNTRAVLSQYRFNELIGQGSRLAEAEAAILAKLQTEKDDSQRTLGSLGITPHIVGLAQVLLPAQTTENVIRRMEQERKILADMQRQEGEAEYDRILADAAEKASKIRAFADRLAEEIKAEGEKAAANAIAELNEEPEFAKLLVWLDALEQTAARNSTFFIPAMNLAPFHLISSGNNMAGVPQPQNGNQAPPLVARPISELPKDDNTSNASGGGN